MSKILEWIRSRRRRPMIEYEEAKREFERIMGRPSIVIRVDLPPELADLRREFRDLEKDEEFMVAVKEFIKSYLREKYGRSVEA